MSIAMRLKVMSFLQYFIWGSWLVTLGSYMINTLHFTGANVGMVYSSKGIAAIIMPGIMGIIADVHTCCVTWCVRAYFFMRHP
jgi:NHS family xanthosine MFS transporter